MSQVSEQLLSPPDGQSGPTFAPYDMYADVRLLNCVRAPENLGTYASEGPNFSYALFGRDSLVTGEQTYEEDQQLAEEIIVTMASLQGTRDNPDNEEEIGRIIHEYRAVTFGGIPVPEECVEVMHRLQRERGEPESEVMYHYDTVDATPLYIRFVKKYVDKYGEDILDRPITNKDGEPTTIRESVRAATKWLTGKLRERDDRLLSYRRRNRGNPEKEGVKGSIENQVWKDSRTSHLFSDGTLPNFDYDVVSTELQGYAYDALKAAAYFFPEQADEYNALSAEVQRSTLEKLWMPEEQFFAQGLAMHHSGEERQLDTLTSEGGLLLDSQLLQDLPERIRNMYVDAIVAMIMGPEFLTIVGIRCRALRHADLLWFVDYHGSLAVWAKETSEIARGLERFGKIKEAAILHNAVLESPRQTGKFFELTYVGKDGTPFLLPHEGVARFATPEMDDPLPTPEPGQTWSIAAAIAAALALNRLLLLMSGLQLVPSQATTERQSATEEVPVS